MTWLRTSSVVIVGVLIVAAVVFFAPSQKRIDGVIWQPDLAYATPSGNWEAIGAHTLVVQWLVVDSVAWTRTAGFKQSPHMPNWSQLQQQPWARSLVLGLAANRDLDASRREVDTYTRQSNIIAKSAPVRPLAWYASIEISPDWRDTDAIKTYLSSLPRPLWVSIYGGYDMAAHQYVAWVKSWLPKKVHILFQDGVGVDRESISAARTKAQALIKAFGANRVSVVLEAFAITNGGQIHSASVWRIAAQLRAYHGMSVYVFAGRYLPPFKVFMLKAIAILGLA